MASIAGIPPNLKGHEHDIYLNSILHQQHQGTSYPPIPMATELINVTSYSVT